MLALMSAMSVILTLSVFFPPFLHYSVIPSCFWSPSLLPSCKAPPSMADSSMLTLGTARSLLVDSSVCETTKDHVFLGVTCEDGEGRCVVRLLRQRKPNSCINYSGIPAVHLSAHPPLPLTEMQPRVETRVVLVGEAGRNAALLKALQVSDFLLAPSAPPPQSRPGTLIWTLQSWKDAWGAKTKTRARALAALGLSGVLLLPPGCHGGTMMSPTPVRLECVHASSSVQHARFGVHMLLVGFCRASGRWRCPW